MIHTQFFFLSIGTGTITGVGMKENNVYTVHLTLLCSFRPLDYSWSGGKVYSTRKRGPSGRETLYRPLSAPKRKRAISNRFKCMKSHTYYR